LSLSLPRRTGFSFVLALVLLLLGTGCGSDEDTSAPPAPPTDHTLVFIDRSASAGGNAQATSVFVDSLDRIVEAYLDRPGDRLSAFVVHEKTLAKSVRLDLRNDVAPIETKEFSDEKALEAARFKREIQRFLDTARTQLERFVRETAARPAFRNWTDLWGTLGVAGEELPPPSDSVRRRVYYLSDMFESMPGSDRRNFDARPPKSRSQAEAWAQTDRPRLDAHMRLRPQRLSGVRFRVLLGPLATKPAAQRVKFYWLALWEEMGIAPDRIDYN